MVKNMSSQKQKIKKADDRRVIIKEPTIPVPVHKRVIKQDVIEYLAKKNNLPVHLAMNALELSLDAIRDIMLFGHPLGRITISGFGIFEMKKLPASKRGSHLMHQDSSKSFNTRKMYFYESKSLRPYIRIDIDDMEERIVSSRL